MTRKKYTKDDFIDAVKTSHSYSEVCRKLGLVDRGGNLNTVKKKIYLYNLDVSHFTGQLWNKGVTFIEQPKIYHKNISDLLTENSYHNANSLRKRLLLEGVKKHKCECCGNSEWNGHPIPLELHHINGDRYDNRLENLVLLCPNCHAQTDNYCGKNKTTDTQKLYIFTNINIKEKRINKQKKCEKNMCPICGKEYEKKHSSQIYCSINCYNKSRLKYTNGITSYDLIEAFTIFKSFLKVGEYFGMSDNAIRKWCKKCGIPTTRSEMDNYINNCHDMQM